MRLDLYLSAQESISRSEAQRLIKAGSVSVNGKTEIRPSFDVTDSDRIAADQTLTRFVSRGGVKLDAALDTFSLNPAGSVCIDVGASTGGFTDCLLSRGAMHVYAVENGHSQLAESLQDDERVTSIEGYNARYLNKSDFPLPIRFAVMDVSFISQTLILPALASVLETGATLVSLVKPQFEVGRGKLGKGGIVRDPSARKDALQKVADSASACGFVLRGQMESPIPGGDGNVEYLFWLEKR